jgi:alkanesulfonate monooxygenase SsuD/methylene tetrahydromethanopterin reductase-like flavin-dependent oxidoreductase (luciferase family)
MKLASFLFTECRDPSMDGQFIQETLQEAWLAEKLGMDAIFLAEHHFDGNCVYVDPLTFASSLAMTTSKVSIGFAVVQTSLYHPLHLAEQLSLLDHLSRGRLIVGLGRGSLVNMFEYAAFGVDPKDGQERFEEIEKILIECWTKERVVHQGKYWNFDIAMLRPRPFSKPMPRLLRGVASEASTIAQAKRGWPVLLPPLRVEALKNRTDVFAQTMSAAGFDDDAVRSALAQSWVFCEAIVTETDREAEDVGVPYIRQMQEYRAAMSPTYRDLVPINKTGIPGGVVCGSPATVRERMAQIAATGIGGAIMRFRLGPMPAEFVTDGLKLFMAEVAPSIPKSAGPVLTAVN